MIDRRTLCTKKNPGIVLAAECATCVILYWNMSEMSSSCIIQAKAKLNIYFVGNHIRLSDNFNAKVCLHVRGEKNPLDIYVIVALMQELKDECNADMYLSLDNVYGSECKEF